VGSFAIIRPRDDQQARQASDWADELIKQLTAGAHRRIADIDDRTPPDAANILGALAGSSDLVCYFGHGDENSWLTGQLPTLDTGSATAAKGSPANGRAIVSVACKTGCNLGPAAITAGVQAWLGFTTKIAAIKPHKTTDPIGSAIVDGLALLGNRGTMQQARDQLASNFDQLVTDYDTGRYMMHPEAEIGYFAAMAMRDHVVVHGTVSFQPLP
jgi:hypothetical protein